MPQDTPASGHVFRRDGKRGSVWYAKFRLPDGRQVQQRIGPAHTGRGRPPAATFSERTARAWLDARLDEADADRLPQQRPTMPTFAEAAAEWLRYVAEDHAVKPSTLRAYRSSVRGHFNPAFGRRIDAITDRDLERWRGGLTVSARTKNKLLTELYGIFRRAQKAYGLQANPAALVDKLKDRRQVDIKAFSPEEIRALVRAAAESRTARCS